VGCLAVLLVGTWLDGEWWCIRTSVIVSVCVGEMAVWCARQRTQHYIPILNTATNEYLSYCLCLFLVAYRYCKSESLIVHSLHVSAHRIECLRLGNLSLSSRRRMKLRSGTAGACHCSEFLARRVRKQFFVAKPRAEVVEKDI
jgi:hypothetical protein